MRGDLVFYPGDPHSLFDRVTMRMTNGPFVHVGVEYREGFIIDSRARIGVMLHEYSDKGLSKLAIDSFGASADDVYRGISWLMQRVAERAHYSLGDILSHLPVLMKLGVIVGVAHSFDCSDLVARYIDIVGINRVGGIALGTLDDNPGTIAPNDIARAAGLIK